MGLVILIGEDRICRDSEKATVHTKIKCEKTVPTQGKEPEKNDTYVKFSSTYPTTVFLLWHLFKFLDL